MLSDLQRRDHNAHVIAYIQNKYCPGAIKPMRREFAERGLSGQPAGLVYLGDALRQADAWLSGEDTSDTNTVSDLWR